MKCRHTGFGSGYQNLVNHERIIPSSGLSKTSFENLAGSKSLPVCPALKGIERQIVWPHLSWRIAEEQIIKADEPFSFSIAGLS